jgi:hypothetical protein
MKIELVFMISPQCFWKGFKVLTRIHIYNKMHKLNVEARKERKTRMEMYQGCDTRGPSFPAAGLQRQAESCSAGSFEPSSHH